MLLGMLELQLDVPQSTVDEPQLEYAFDDDEYSPTDLKTELGIHTLASIVN